MPTKKKTATKKKATSPRAAINAAKKAFKKGTPGASARLDKAITAFAARSCKAKSSVSGAKKKRTTKKKKK